MGGTTGDLLGTGNSGGGSFAQPQVQRGSLDSVGGGGRTYFQQRPDVGTSFNQNSQGMNPTQFAQQHFQQFGQNEGNVSDPSKQFFQPVYQPQYQDYSMGNRMGVSQYGQNMGGFGGLGGGFGGPEMRGGSGFGPSMPPYAAMGNYANSGAPKFGNLSPEMMAAQSGSSSLGGPMPQMQQPFNPFTNSFGGGFGGGFMPQQQFRQPMQQFMPQQQFQPQMNMGMQTPFSSGMSQPAPQRTSSGPAQAIVGRSSQMRGTPNVMRRAQGGITSLLDEV